MLSQRIARSRTSHVHTGFDEFQSWFRTETELGGGSDHAFPLLHPHLGGDGIDVPG